MFEDGSRVIFRLSGTGSRYASGTDFSFPCKPPCINAPMALGTAATPIKTSHDWLLWNCVFGSGATIRLYVDSYVDVPAEYAKSSAVSTVFFVPFWGEA